MEFKDITMADIPTIREYISHQTHGTCDFTVGGIFLWADYFKYQFCIENGVLYIRGHDIDVPENIAYTVPIGSCRNCKQNIEALVAYTMEAGERCILNAVPERAKNCVARHFPESTITYLEDYSDYVYDIDNLREFKTKPTHKKRLLFNQFVHNYTDYTIEVINPESAKDILKEYAEWNTVIDNHNAEYDRFATMQMLEYYDQYGFDGIAIRVGGRLVAFCAGEAVGEYMYVHIEKADRMFKGSYQAINKFFADYMGDKYPNVKYVNREDDMGDIGLRQSKKSYDPVFMLGKYSIEIVGEEILKEEDDE